MNRILPWHEEEAPLHGQGRRLRLAVISTYDELCGIAGYTRALERQLRPLTDLTVFDLDQYLLRSPHGRVQRLGDAHVREIASRLPEFDAANIQLEHGTLGRTPKRILRRLKLLVRAAPALSVTFHTVLNDEGIPWEQLRKDLGRLRIGAANATVRNYRRGRLLSVGVYALLREEQARKPVQVIVHTRRDMRLLRDVYRLKNVHHHPLSFVDPERARQIRATATRDSFPMLRHLPPGTKLIGTFGFLSRYKGFDTAIRALRELPEDHHLLIFGGVHPQTIQRNEPIDPYVGQLLDEGRIGKTLLDEFGSAGRSGIAVQDAAAGLLGRHPRDLSSRIHFLGVLNDDDFMTAMAVCDTVVLPYLEVGQSSSGPISIALEMGCRVIASRTLAFLQYSRYHPDEIEFFDIGNYHELAERIAAGNPATGRLRQLAFNTRTNAALYLQANLPPDAATRAVPRQASPVAAAAPA